MKPMHSIDEIGGYLAQMRAQNMMTLRDLSAKVGVTIAFLNDIEHGRRTPSIAMAERIASALDIGARNTTALCAALVCIREDITPKQLVAYAKELRS